MVNTDLLDLLPPEPERNNRRILDVSRMRMREERARAQLPELMSKFETERRRKFEEDAQRKWDETIPRRWKKASLSLFETGISSKGRQIVNDIIKGNPLSSAVVWSPTVGNGKTFFCYALLNELRALGVATISNTGFHTESDIADIAMSGFERDDKLEDFVHGKKFLFIDDVSNRSQYGWKNTNESNRESVWFDIINYAYSNGLFVFITSNKDANSIRSFMGEEAFNRLWHLTSNGSHFIRMDRQSVRSDIARRMEDYYH